MLRQFSFRLLYRLCLLTLAALIGGVAPQPAIAFAVHHDHPKRAAREMVESMEEQWRLATLNGDVQAMDRLLSEDFVGITASGQVATKAQQLARLHDRVNMLTQLDLSDIKVKLIGSVAIVTSRAMLTGSNSGAPISGIFRYTRVYQRLANGTWKITSFEATPAREGGPKNRPDGPRPEANATPAPQP